MRQSNGPLEALKNAPHNAYEGAKTVFYEFVSPSNGQFMQEVGGNMETAGAVMVGTGVAAPEGGLMMVVGGGIELTGAIVEVAGEKLHNGKVSDSTAANLGAKLIVEVLPMDELLKKAGVPESQANNELVKHLAKEGTEEVLKPVVENVIKNVKN